MRISSLTVWLSIGLGFSACSGTTPPINNVQLVKWSEASTWASGKVPVAGEAVEIPLGKNVLLDVSALSLGDVTINGSLKFAEQDLELSATSIMVHGKLEIGSSDLPFQHQAVITLNGSDQTLNPMNMGTKLIGVMGGQLEMHGASRGIPWTKLNATAAKGATTITLDGNPGWRVGDKIAIASTDFDPAQAEENVITAVSGNTVTLGKALAYMHYGDTQTIAGTTLDERAEVALLSRNIRVQGDDTSSTSSFGGHIMNMGSGAMRVENVELFRMGQKQKTGRYPIHWHMMGDNATGSYLKNSSIHNTFNRCVTIHGSNNILLENNAAFDAIGHCYFLEDGAETGLVLEHNLGFLTKRPKDGEELLPTDTNPSTYWITNPANTFRNNVAAGSQGIGFWIALPERPMGLSSADKVAANVNIYPRRTALTEFSGNISHSNDNRGLDVDNGPNPNSTPKPMQGETTYYEARVNPVPPGKDANGNYLPDSAVVENLISNFTAYKNRERGVWLRGGNLHLKNALLADNAIGATFASNETMVENSVMIGESKNVGQKAYSTQPVGLDGRSLPRPWEADFPIRGFEFYDGKVGAVNTTFANYVPNAQRGASGLSYLRFTAFDIDANNFSSNLTFNNANEVFFEDHAVPTTPTSDDGSDGYRAAVFNDSDGKLTNIAGASIVVNNPFILDGCTTKSAWNASICNLEYGRFYFNNLDASAAELSPVSMTRQDGAKPVHQMWGVPNDAANENFQTTIINKRNYSLAPNGAMPGHSRIEFRDRKPGDWLLASIPWTGTLKIYRDYWIDNRNLLTAAANLSDLNASTGEKYLLENGTLTLKFQIKAARDWSVLDVCQTDLCK